MRKPFKALLLDLDNTLYDYQPRHKESLAAVYDRLSECLEMPMEGLETYYLAARKVVHHQLLGTAASHNRLLGKVNEVLRSEYWYCRTEGRHASMSCKLGCARRIAARLPLDLQPACQNRGRLLLQNRRLTQGLA